MCRGLAQVEYFFEKYGIEYSLDQRDEYGHSPAHWMALNGHAHITRSVSMATPTSSGGFQWPRPHHQEGVNGHAHITRWGVNGHAHIT